jgi:hypothetical protein
MPNNQLTKQELIEDFHSLPPWKNEGDLNEQEWARFIEVAKIVQSVSPDTVGAALGEFIKQVIQKEYQGYESESKPFILMRVVFKLPEIASAEKRFSYKGWTNWPEPDENNQVNLSWPISWNNNNPKLIASYEGSMGLPYAAAAEYRFLLENFPFRQFL